MWTTTVWVGGGHEQDVHKRKIFRSETQNIWRFEDRRHPLPQSGLIAVIVLRVNIRNVNYFEFRTFARDTIRTSVHGVRGGGENSLMNDLL